MKTRMKVLLLLAAASVAIAGCSAMEGMMGGGGGPGMRLADCNGAQCQVWITVNDSASACTIVDPGILPVVKPHRRLLITWHLRSGDFTTDGITFKQGQGTVFSGNQRTQKGVYQVTDDYSTPNNAGHFHYRIRIRTDSGHTCDLDPEVVNG